MNDLIKITKQTIGTEIINSVNARETYEYLGLAKGQFSRWIKSAIDKYDFIENEDYITIDTNVEGIKEYIVSLDMAKELCLVSNTPKGKETRKYFIQFEKQGKEIIKSQSLQIQLMQEAINQLSIMDNRVTELEQTRRLENWQELALHTAKNKKVYELAEKHGFKDDKAMISKLHNRVWKALKTRYNIPRYNELPCLKFDDGIAFINNLTLGAIL